MTAIVSMNEDADGVWVRDTDGALNGPYADRGAARADHTLECIDAHAFDEGECRGSIELRPSLTGTGTPIPRCDLHWLARQERDERDRIDYPDSPIPPAWFDPMAAGERWDDE